MTTVSLVDDHVLLRNSLAKIINHFDGYKVLDEADNGQDFIDKVNKKNPPDMVLLDISMPVMNGFETAAWIRANLPDTRVLVLSMMDNELSVIKMINLGARGYILKDSKPVILKEAFDNIMQKGFYSNDLVSSTMIHYVSSGTPGSSLPQGSLQLSDNETQFIRLACTDRTYKEIATEMNSTPRSVEMYRNAVFTKLNVKSRVGLVLFAIKEGLVQL